MKTIAITLKTAPILIVAFALFMFTSCNETVQKTNGTATSQNASEVSYTSKMTKADKKKYYDAGSVVYEVKYKPDGFKLRTASSKLLWKVKLYDAKIKISDNEENLNPYEIKLLDTYSAKLEKEGKVIARTSYDLATKEQSITYSASSEKTKVNQSYTPSLLVDAITELAKDQKEILISELVAKGY